MSYRIFLDDVRMPPHDGQKWFICRSTAEFVQVLRVRGLPSFISFDHDLSGDDTGMRAAHQLVNYVFDNGLVLPRGFDYAVHSMNPVGASNIRSLMECFINVLE